MSGYGSVDKITKAGDVATGTIVFTGTPPLQIPAGVIAGDVLTSDGAGNAAWAAPTGSSTGALKLTQVPVQTSAFAASANQVVPVDTTAGNVTVTLPAAPAGGTMMAVKQVTVGTGRTVTVACAGADVYNKTGGATTLTLSLQAQGVLLEYNSGIWMVLSDDLPMSQLDARYVPLLPPCHPPYTLAPSFFFSLFFSFFTHRAGGVMSGPLTTHSRCPLSAVLQNFYAFSSPLFTPNLPQRSLGQPDLSASTYGVLTSNSETRRRLTPGLLRAARPGWTAGLTPAYTRSPGRSTPRTFRS